MIDIILLFPFSKGLLAAVLVFIGMALAMIPVLLAAALLARGAVAVWAWIWIGPHREAVRRIQR